MNLRKLTTIALVLALAGNDIGCNLVGTRSRTPDSELEHYRSLARTTVMRDVTTPVSDIVTIADGPPRTLRNLPPDQQWLDLSLADAIQLAFQNSRVLRDLGGTVIRAPDVLKNALQPAISATDPQAGLEAALADFDAQLSSSVMFEKNDRMLNNFITAGGTRIFRQDLVTAQAQISKRSVSGTRTTLRGVSTYDANNASFNKFPNVYDSWIDLEVRQPLLQGAGATFNRIAGPDARPGQINGIVVARLNNDISLLDFELGVRDFLSNVENAYWELYFAYRDLDARTRARDAALETWRSIKTMVDAGQAGGTAEREAQAREQYFRAEEDLQNALSGKLQDFTSVNNGSGGGSFRGNGGVLVTERRLRLILGLPITDDRLVRPADEPSLAPLLFDWNWASAEAVSRRTELQRQRLLVKRREMELLANRNFLLPRVDLVGRYRWRGLGNDLIGDTPTTPDPADPNNYFGNGSLDNLFNGDFQEGLVGGEMTLPVGFRRAYSAVQNSQLQLARECSILREQERQVTHDLSNALAELERAHELTHTTLNRLAAAERHVEILREKILKDLPVNLDQLFDAERRLADADIQHHRSRVEYALAIKNVHFEKGTLLDYGNVYLSERNELGPIRTAPAPTEVEALPPALEMAQVPPPVRTE
jgi:outer membrane protein TolC